MEEFLVIPELIFFLCCVSLGILYISISIMLLYRLSLLINHEHSAVI